MLKLLLLCLGLIPFIGQSQVTFKVISLPENHPDSASIFIAGNFNSWNPGDSSFRLNTYNTITIDASIPLEFKFTLGQWSTVECDASGTDIPNRTYTSTTCPDTVEITISNWKDPTGRAMVNPSTKTKNVTVIEDFEMPQLERSRRIWIYLPPDYNDTSRTYPVIYMHDGQNLFDASTSFSGEWHVDETLNTLFDETGFAAIVVGVENGGTLRIPEYTPWINEEYGGGEGAAYADFLVYTLKPFIDANYRTQPDAGNTAIIGSSLGGLISFYTAFKYPAVFSRVAALSPAFWFNPEIIAFSETLESQPAIRLWMSAGANEPISVQEDMDEVKMALLRNGNSVVETRVYPDMGHNEDHWSATFPEIVQWLFLTSIR